MINLTSTPAFNKSTIVGLLILLATFASAQRHEIGLQGGLTSMVGDVGRTGYILQKPFGDIGTFGLPTYTGLIYRMNFNPHQTLRFDLGAGNVQFSDAYAKEAYRKQRNLNNRNIKYFQGTNTIYNADAQFEYNFFPVNNEQRSMLSPYIFGGLGGMAFSNQKIIVQLTDSDNNGVIDQLEGFFPYGSVKSQLISDYKISIPFGAGLKYKFKYNWAIFGEFKFRYTNTDNIDYSKISAKNIIVKGNISERKLTKEELNTLRTTYISAAQFGNINSKDWVNAITLGISYSFGRPPCYCN